MDQKFKLKVVIIGEHETGKTSLIKAFVEQKFSADYRPTIGTNIFIKKLEMDGDEITLTVWDIAGQERWTSMRPLYYRGTAGAFIVGDLTKKVTFDQISRFWAPDLKKHAGDNIPIMIIANKSDLEHNVTQEDIDACAADIGAVGVMETSAKIGDNVNEAFIALTKIILGR
ncbi:MAG TPA: Rab family GTPase [Candidatus Lokiarchaeia archaeon]|nr:Rab family GTPase [Candidatus Lokiarchaeia archaeon]